MGGGRKEEGGGGGEGKEVRREEGMVEVGNRKEQLRKRWSWKWCEGVYCNSMLHLIQIHTWNPKIHHTNDKFLLNSNYPEVRTEILIQMKHLECCRDAFPNFWIVSWMKIFFIITK